LLFILAGFKADEFTPMKKHILIIEDDLWLADIYKHVLEGNFKITIKHNAQAAIETLDDKKPAIILLDMMLPGGNGVAFLQELRSFEDTSSVPVLVITGTRLTSKHKKPLQDFGPIKIMDKSELTPDKLKENINELIKENK
jgi:CheY-like chemotaxis protein